MAQGIDLSFCVESLNPNQREAVEHRGRPLLVVAGAGTGKTKVITHRIAHLISQGAPPGRILAVTFTNKAAEEMRRRVESLVPGHGHMAWIHTFHSFAARILRRHAKLLSLAPYFTIYDQDDQKKAVVESLKDLGQEQQKNKAALFVSVISRAKDDLLDAKSYAIHTMTAGDPFREVVARVYERYEQRLSQAGALDFGDLLLKACGLLREFSQVREYYQEYFLHLLVDEYQDTNRAQYVLTKTMAARHRNLCVVGDPDQSIYQWRGANIRNIMEFEKDFSDARLVVLEENYRSTGSILGAASEVISHNRYRKPKVLWTRKPTGDPVRVEELSNEIEEARWVVRRVASLIDQGHSLKDFAVFYRTNAQSRCFEEAFRTAGVPHRVVGAVRFYERKEVKDALCYARVLVNPSDEVSLKRIINVPARGLGKTSQEALEKTARDKGMTLYEVLTHGPEIAGISAGCRRGAHALVHLFEKLRPDAGRRPPSEMMICLLNESGYLPWLEKLSEDDPEAASRINNLQELVNALKDYEDEVARGTRDTWGAGDADPASRSGDGATLASYLENVALQTDIDTYDPEQSAVTLMTVHLAKGLEFPVVFLTGLEEGLFPIGAGGETDEELEEERRLCYVGMTRAREVLNLTFSSTRRIFGKVYSNLPSRFILEARLLAEAPPPVSASLDFPRRPAGGRGPAVHGRLKVGSRVKHPDFGPGVVVQRSGSGEDLKVTVRFDGGMIRKLLVRFAPLEPL